MKQVLVSFTMLLFLTGCNYGPKEEQPKYGDNTIIIPVDKFTRCSEEKVPEIPLCETSRDLFRVKKTQNITLDVYERPDNTRCCYKLKIDGVTREYCFPIDAPSCPVGTYED